MKTICGLPPEQFRNAKVVKDVEVYKKSLKLYLVALPAFPNDKGFCHRTTLIRAEDELDARSRVAEKFPHENIGDIKEQKY